MVENALDWTISANEQNIHTPKETKSNWWAELGASTTATQDISQVETVWRELEKFGIESPGQSLDFTKAWIKSFKIPVEEQLYVTGEYKGKVVALLPLRRVKRMGANLLTWFFGSHVGCNAPLIKRDAFEAMSKDERAQVWQRMRRAINGVDLVCLHAVPALYGSSFFSGKGCAIEIETLYRSEFESWAACQSAQHTRSRKKHDKQQGIKLRALGQVKFEQLTSGDPGVEKVLETLFAQKAARFKQWGIANPFFDPGARKFYQDIFHGNNELIGKLHVLSLDDEIVAVRYNLAHRDKIFALISSMSDRVDLRPGSPGKQNVLRAMQAIFESGYSVCDMGAGFSDEKRQWCNKTIPLKTHYIALNAKGEMVAKIHRFKYRARKFIKNNEHLFGIFKSARSVARGKSKPAS